jgi:catechol 2,3-dioxygenase-like lactoylglutathione lyase family enzyme
MAAVHQALSKPSHGSTEASFDTHATPSNQGDRTMTRLNHINLAVSNVPELSRFFQAGFNFHVAAVRGIGKFTVLRGEDGFTLTLTHDKTVTSTTYPAPFHVGFQCASTDEVQQYYSRILDAGFDAPTPDILNRGGDKAFGFYCHAPGNVIVEVSSRAA